MKPNEIGHFPFREKSKDYPRMDLTWIGTKENPEIKWVPRFKMLGEIQILPIQAGGFDTSNCVFDLQTAHDCFYAADILCNGVNYIYLLGSGWADYGFPFCDEIFDPEDPYESGKGCYAFLAGKARKKFLQLCKQDCLPTFNECFTTLGEFVILDKP